MTTPRRNPHYWLERRAQRRTGYPLATLAYYGPDASRASKAVVGIMDADKDEAREMRKWSSETSDLRSDPVILSEILAYLDDHHV